tara:strand:- start:47 stop:448 length:402 start_codon:yes stop_codon:yes gene_type:complete
MNCPLGLSYRAKCIRTLKSIWDQKSTKDYLIDSVRRTTNNAKPIIVIDDTTKKASCFLINASLTGFEEYENKVLCRQIELIADYFITLIRIQKSNKSKEDKEKYCKLNTNRNYSHKILTTKDEKEFNKFVKEL